MAVVVCREIIFINPFLKLLSDINCLICGVMSWTDILDFVFIFISVYNCLNDFVIAICVFELLSNNYWRIKLNSKILFAI